MDDINDQEIAAAMGFSSFGGTKKRRLSQAEEKHTQTSSPQAADTKNTRSPATSPQDEAATVTDVSFGGPSIPRAELGALRQGVIDASGDKAYFLPSFVEDPWAKTRNAT